MDNKVHLFPAERDGMSHYLQIVPVPKTDLCICIALALCLLLAGCVNTEGNLKLEGKIIDESTKVQIPGREVIIQGLLKSNNKIVPVNAGHFSTDSSGGFKYILKRIKGVRYYNLCIVGDSDYASVTNKINLTQLKESSKYLFFSVNKLVDLTINIQKISNVAYRDTIYLTWESNNADFRTLYPYKVNNYGVTDNTFALLDYYGLRWIGGNINSTIKTKVFADKLTLIHWKLVRNGMRKEITDTIICKRDIEHLVSFEY